MKPTVESGNYRSSTGTDTSLDLLLQQMRTAHNRVQSTEATLTTASTNTDTVIWQDDDEIPHDSHGSLDVTVVASSSDGTAYGKFESTMAYVRTATGSATQVGATTVKHTPIRSSASITVTLDISSDTLRVRVNDGNQGTLDWKAWIELRQE